MYLTIEKCHYQSFADIFDPIGGNRQRMPGGKNECLGRCAPSPNLFQRKLITGTKAAWEGLHSITAHLMRV